MPQQPDLPAIGADDDLDDASVRKLLKDIFPAPEDPLTQGLSKGEQYKLAKLYFPKDDEHGEESVTGYQALDDEARKQFLSNFFVEIEVSDHAGNTKRFFVSEYDADRAKRFGARQV
ncbi:MAG: hypothetical protein COV45_00850 [Deltaproteobacteria bacterium CG11_big_fil_rev_8_21_14_0_20_47_16]|nr:MAG: hypothetical protein COV45_00850 [Deltaproteobacteria bacterium CG11_big_fil_rev_8_21_14_0_20_47_16]